MRNDWYSLPVWLVPFSLTKNGFKTGNGSFSLCLHQVGHRGDRPTVCSAAGMRQKHSYETGLNYVFRVGLICRVFHYNCSMTPGAESPLKPPYDTPTSWVWGITYTIWQTVRPTDTKAYTVDTPWLFHRCIWGRHLFATLSVNNRCGISQMNQ